MNRLKVYAIYLGFALLFAVVFAAMLALLVAAVIGVPSGVMFGAFGVIIQLFQVDFIICDLPAPVMIFGGASVAFASAFLGLVAVKTGYFVCRVFISMRNFCDRLRGW